MVVPKRVDAEAATAKQIYYVCGLATPVALQMMDRAPNK
jgi:hypothetical protein